MTLEDLGVPVRGESHLCSFCRASQEKVAKLIAGPDVNICDVCVDRFYDVCGNEFAGESNPEAANISARQVCSFCGKRRDKVEVLAGNDQHSICSECIALCSEIVDENDARNNRPPRKRRPALPEDLWESIEHLAKYRIDSESVFHVYVRLAVDSAKQEEFMKIWRRRLSAALILDGAKAVMYVFGGISGSKARWGVLAHYTTRCHELGEATKCAIGKMHESGILLRPATWYFLDGACHSV